MKIYRIPEKTEAIIFDIDNTLYRNDPYYNSQDTLLVQKLSQKLGESYEGMQGRIKKFRTGYAEQNNGRKLSLGNAFLHFGCSIEENAEWRLEIFEPEKYLTEDEKLFSALNKMQKKIPLIALTNNHTKIAERTLSALGVKDLFKKIIGLDITKLSKPHEKIYKITMEGLNIDYSSVLNVGDRFEVDLELPLHLGMGGVLVENMEDVYSLPDIIK